MFVLEIVRKFVSRLVELDVIRARNDQHSNATVFPFLDGTSKMRSLRLQLADCRIDIVAHQRDRMMARIIVRLVFPFAVRGVHAHLARTRLEDEPVVIEILGDVLLPEDVT